MIEKDERHGHELMSPSSSLARIKKVKPKILRFAQMLAMI